MTRSTTGAWRAAGAGRRVATRSTQVAADPARFESVYRSCQAELYRYVLSIVRDPHAAEDVMQSSMTRAMEALAHEERDFELRPWLFRIAHNEAISRFRRERTTLELDDASLAAAARTAPTASVPETAERNEAVEQLWKDLAELPERQRQALVLRELSGMGHDEIGSVLGTSGRAVKQTIFEARRGLLECSEGRAMVCAEVQQTLSDGDGRVRRSRRMRAHLADCSACAAFDAALTTRPERLAALAPALPLVVSASLLAHLFPGAKGVVAASAATSGAGGVLSTGGLGGLVMSKLAVAATVGAVAVGGTGVAAVAIRSGGAPQTVQPASPAAGGGGQGVGGAAGAAPVGSKSVAGANATTPAGSTPRTTPGSTTPEAEARAKAAADAKAAGEAKAASSGKSSSAPGATVSAAAKAKAKSKATSEAASAKRGSDRAKTKSSSSSKGSEKPAASTKAPAKADPPSGSSGSTKPTKTDPPTSSSTGDAGASAPDAAAGSATSGAANAESAPSTNAAGETSAASGGAAGHEPGRTAK